MKAVALVLVCTVAGCGKDAPPRAFVPKVIQSVELDGFSLPIPAGYRQLAELVDRDRAMRIEDQCPQEATVVVSERIPPEALWVAILAFTDDMTANPDACAKLAAEVASSSQLAKPQTALQTTPLGEACTFALEHPAETSEILGDTPARKVRDYWLPHAGKVLLVECGGADVVTRDRLCLELLASATAR